MHAFTSLSIAKRKRKGRRERIIKVQVNGNIVGEVWVILSGGKVLRKLYF
jgi:hypothetical protein